MILSKQLKFAIINQSYWSTILRVKHLWIFSNFCLLVKIIKKRIRWNAILFFQYSFMKLFHENWLYLKYLQNLLEVFVWLQSYFRKSIKCESYALFITMPIEIERYCFIKGVITFRLILPDMFMISIGNAVMHVVLN